VSYHEPDQFRDPDKYDEWGFPRSWTLPHKIRSARAGVKYLRMKWFLGRSPPSLHSLRILEDFLTTHEECVRDGASEEARR